jgi:hypothetical protein
MNEEEELPNLVPNLYTDWVPPLPAKSKPNPSRFINNVLTYEEFAEEFRKKIRTQLPECAQFTDVKSIRATHGIRWTKITNEMKALVNLDTDIYNEFKETFYNNRRSAISRSLKVAQLNN